MPYRIEKRGEQWCVIKRDDGSTVACHDSEQQARDQIAAININEHKGYITPRPLNIIEQFKTFGHKPGVTVKRVGGERYMFIVTSNSYRDREREFITTKALAHYVEKAWIANDVCDTHNVHLFWHDGDPIGDIVWADMQGPFLLEVSKERSDALIQLSTEHKATISQLWDFVEAHPEMNWGASHGFRFDEKRINPAKNEATYDEIQKFETSTLPLDNAANQYTFSGVIMDKDRNAFLDRMLDTPGIGDELRQGVDKLEKKLDTAGVQHKALDETAVKGLIDNIRAKTESYVGTLVDSAPDGLVDQLVQLVVAALAGAAESEPTEPGQEAAPEQAMPSHATMSLGGKDTRPGQVKLLDTLTGTQQYLVQMMESIDKQVKALQPMNELAEAFKTLTTQVGKQNTDIQAIKAQLAGRPRAASQAQETITEDKEMVKQATDQLATFSPFWGVNVRPKEQ